MTIPPRKWLKVRVLGRILFEESVYSLVFSGRGFDGRRLFPVNLLNAIAFMNMAKAMHNRLYSAYSLENVLASNIALRAPVQNPFGWSVCHDNVNIIRDRVRGDRSDTACNLMRAVESVFIVFVRKSLVAEGRRVRGDIDCKFRSVLQRERVSPFIQKGDSCFIRERPRHNLDSEVVIFRIS